MDVNVDDQIPTDFDREKWRTEKGFRERELVIKEAELELRRNEQAGSGWLKAEFVYLAVVLDAFSRKVVGWALDRTLANRLTI